MMKIAFLMIIYIPIKKNLKLIKLLGLKYLIVFKKVMKNSVNTIA